AGGLVQVAIGGLGEQLQLVDRFDLGAVVGKLGIELGCLFLVPGVGSLHGSLDLGLELLQVFGVLGLKLLFALTQGFLAPADLGLYMLRNALDVLGRDDRALLNDELAGQLVFVVGLRPHQAVERLLHGGAFFGQGGDAVLAGSFAQLGQGIILGRLHLAACLGVVGTGFVDTCLPLLLELCHALLIPVVQVGQGLD